MGAVNLEKGDWVRVETMRGARFGVVANTPRPHGHTVKLRLEEYPGGALVASAQTYLLSRVRYYPRSVLDAERAQERRPIFYGPGYLEQVREGWPD